MSEVLICRDKFQDKVDEIQDDNYLHFTCETCNPGVNTSQKKTKSVSMAMDNPPSLSYDLEIFWDKNRRILFNIHKNKNKLIKYINKQSTHTKSTFKAVPNGVSNMLSKLTSWKEENSKMRINERFPGHKMALTKAGINLKSYSTLE